MAQKQIFIHLFEKLKPVSASVLQNKDALQRLRLPAYFKQKNMDNTSRLFYHKERGRLLFLNSLFKFLNRLGISDDDIRFEYYYKELQNPVFFAETVDRLSVPAVFCLADTTYYQKLSPKEQNTIKRDYIYALISFFTEQSDDFAIETLTHYFIIHYFYTLTLPTAIKKSTADWCAGIVQAKYNGKAEIKEKILQTEEEVVFCLVIKRKTVVRLQGKSIKTLRTKAYNMLLKQLLEEEL